MAFGAAKNPYDCCQEMTAASGDGIWLLDLQTLEFERVGPPCGMLQAPVNWSPDGRYLLIASLQAAIGSGNRCSAATPVASYAYVDMETGGVQQLAGVDPCDAVLGWAQIP